MARMFLVLVLIAAGVAGLGIYMGWFHFSSGSDGGSAHVTVSVDKDQIEKDKDKVVNKLETATRKAQD